LLRKLSALNSWLGANSGKFSLVEVQRRVRLESRGDLVRFREIHVQPLRTELVVAVQREPDGVSHRNPCRRHWRRRRRLRGDCHRNGERHEQSAATDE